MKASGQNKVIIDYLYLDLNKCDRCIGTDEVLEEVIKTLTPALKLAGYEIVLNKTEMATAEIAAQYMFESSPTIRVNGKDICLSIDENRCGCCSDIVGCDIDCRVFEYNGKIYEVLPKEMLADAILQTVFSKDKTNHNNYEYIMPNKYGEY